MRGKKLEKAIEKYFRETKFPTVAGLAKVAKMTRKEFWHYSKKDKKLKVIDNARKKLEKIYEELLIYKKRGSSSVVGVIFALKNMGWIDESTSKHEGHFTINLKSYKNKNGGS